MVGLVGNNIPNNIVALLRHLEVVVAIGSGVAAQELDPFLFMVGLVEGDLVHVLAERVVNFLSKLGETHVAFLQNNIIN